MEALKYKIFITLTILLISAIVSVMGNGEALWNL